MTHSETIVHKAKWTRSNRIGLIIIFLCAALILFSSGDPGGILLGILFLAPAVIIYFSPPSKEVIVTNKRLILFKTRREVAIPLEKIEGVKIQLFGVVVFAGSLFNTMTLAVANKYELAAAIEKARASRLEELRGNEDRGAPRAGGDASNAAPSPSTNSIVANDIAALTSLHERGVISEEEFRQKVKMVLNK